MHPVYASSNALPHSHARLGSGCWLGFTGRDSNPLNSNKWFPPASASPTTRFILALPYIVAQVIGGVIGAYVLYVIASGAPNFDLVASGFATNGYGDHSPGHYTMIAALVCEVVMTFFFLFVILGATDSRAPAGFAPIAIGLCLTLIHLISIPVTNTSVNPARSTGPALFVGGAAVEQLWLFWVAPIIGAIIAGVVYPVLTGAKKRALSAA